MRLNLRWTIIIAIIAALVAHSLLFLPANYVVHSLAMLVLCAFLPGVLLVELIVGRSDAPPQILERLVLSVGMGYAALVVGMLLLSYIPGPLETWHVLVAYDSLLAVLVILVWLGRARSSITTSNSEEALGAEFPSPPQRSWTIGILLLIVVLGAVLRMGNLGYAEFHGDEARAVLRGAAVIQGYDNVLMLHKKGPAEILVPAATFALTGRVTETTARLPFALAGLTALLITYLLGRRMFGTVAGLAAATLLMVDGYAVAFSRIVQYQSFVILTSALVVLILFRLYWYPRAPLNYLSLAAILLATGMLSHYEAGLVVLPSLFLLIATILRHRGHRLELFKNTLYAGAIGLGVVALFYLPFLLSPQFKATYTYLVERRLGVGGGGLPYNNLVDFFNRTTIYSSTYYVMFLILLALVGMVAAYRRGLGKLWGNICSALLLIGTVLLFWRPNWFALDGTDWTILFFTAAFLVVWLAPKMLVAERTLWLWLGRLVLFTIFLTAKPRTHVYVFATAWVLIGGMVIQRSWNVLRSRISYRSAMVLAGASATALTALFGTYVYIFFVRTNTEVLRTWLENRPAAYWTVYDTPDNKALFGFPLANGWKVIGQLYAQEDIQGTYGTNEFEFWTPAWYTRGEWRCEDQADWFFQIANFQPDPEGYRLAIETQIANDFKPWARVTINSDPRMVINKRSQQQQTMQVFPLEEYAPVFDAAADAYLPLSYPVVEPDITMPMHVNLGNKIWLEGYDLQYDAPIEPGDVLTLTLYWRAQQSIDESYKVFNQSYYGDGKMVAQQDGYPVCGARGTWMWDPGELIVDTYRLPVAEDAPEGLYPLYTGMYIQETLDRLNVLDASGQSVGDQVHLTDIRIGPE